MRGDQGGHRVAPVTVTRQQLDAYLDELLRPGDFNDYGPNGLQVEGAPKISRVAFAVSATAESIAAAGEQHAEALVVHHGLFWEFHGARPIIGPFAARIRPLIKNDINLFAYHLPLDAHPFVGNNAVLCRELGIQDLTPFGEFKGSEIGFGGVLPAPVSASALQKQLASILDHDVILASPDETAQIESVGVITGGASNEWTQAQAAGFDAYVTGEISEHNWHEAREAGMHFFAGGHNATERFGVQALMQQIQSYFSLDCFYIPSPNPA